MCRRLLLAAFLVVVTASLTAQTNLSFELKASGNASGGVVQGDFNQDGKPDIIYGPVLPAGSAQGQLVLELGNGNGTFQVPKMVGPANEAVTLAADLNHDGKLDLVGLGAQDFQVFYGNGDGTFQSPLTFSTTNRTNTIAVGDFYGNGLLDVAVGDYNGSGGVELFRNVGGKDFVPAGTVNFPTGTDISTDEIGAGSINGDGIVDLAVMTSRIVTTNGVSSVSSEPYILWNDGHGNFKTVPLKSYPYPASLSVGDLNQDGRADVIVSYSCNTTVTDKGYDSTCVGYDAFYGQGNNKTVYSHIITDNKDSAGTALAVDVTGNGIADIAAAGKNVSSAQQGLFVWLGHPDGSFDQTPQRYIADTEGGGGLVMGDWNRDGMIDFGQLLAGDGQLELYFNASNRAPCTTSQINHTVTVCQPVDNTYVTSPVRIQANAYDTTRVTALQEYMDHKKVYSDEMNSFDVTLPESLGSHFLTTKAWDTKGTSFLSHRNITVYSGTPGLTCPAALDSASICLPAGATSESPVHILANGYTSVVPTAAQIYIDGKRVVNDTGHCFMNGNCVGGTSYADTAQNLSKGTHALTFKLWDANGNTYTARKTITVD